MEREWRVSILTSDVCVCAPLCRFCLLVLPNTVAATLPTRLSAIPEQYPMTNPYESCVGTPESMAPWTCNEKEKERERVKGSHENPNSHCIPKKDGNGILYPPVTSTTIYSPLGPSLWPNHPKKPLPEYETRSCSN